MKKPDKIDNKIISVYIIYGYFLLLVFNIILLLFYYKVENQVSVIVTIVSAVVPLPIIKITIDKTGITENIHSSRKTNTDKCFTGISNNYENIAERTRHKNNIKKLIKTTYNNKSTNIKIVALTGISGCGKSTILNVISHELNQKNFKVKLYKETYYNIDSSNTQLIILDDFDRNISSVFIVDEIKRINRTNSNIVFLIAFPDDYFSKITQYTKYKWNPNSKILYIVF